MKRRTRILAAAAGTMIALLVADRWVYTPLTKEAADLGRVRRELEESKRLAEARKARGPELAREWEVHRTRLAALSPDAAEAQFQSALQELFRRAGITWDRITPVAVPRRPGFVELHFSAAFECGIQEFAHLLYELDQFEGYLRQERLEVTSEYDRSGKLRVDLRVSTLGGMQS